MAIKREKRRWRSAISWVWPCRWEAATSAVPHLTTCSSAKAFLPAKRSGFQFQAGKMIPCSRSEHERLLESLAELQVPQISFAPCPVLFWHERDYTDIAQNLLVSGETTERLWWGNVGEECGRVWRREGVNCTIWSLAIGCIWLQAVGWITPSAGYVGTNSFIVCYSEHVDDFPAWSF